MKIVYERKLSEFAQRHPNVKSGLQHWLAPSISAERGKTEIQAQETSVLQQIPYDRTVDIEPYPESAGEWLAEVLDMLTDIVDRNADLSLAVVTENDYKQLSAVLEDLIYGIGEDESHPLSSSMAFIGGLIKRYEDEHLPKLVDLFPELKENAPVEANPPNRKSTVPIPIWTETEVAIHAFFSMGILFSEGKRREKAISAYDMVLRLKPDYAEAHYNRGTAKTLICEYAAAITDFDEAIRLKPECVEAYYNRGETKFALNQSEEAYSDFRIALELAEQHRHDNIKVNIQQRLEELNNTK